MNKNIPTLICFLIALAMGWACSNLFQKSLPFISPSHYPAVVGQVQEIVGDNVPVGNVSIFMLTEAKVTFVWEGKPYIAQDAGYSFTEAQYREALATKQCTVYVDRANPELSLLSKSVPFGQLFFCGVFGIGSITLLIIGVKRLI